MLVDFVVGLSIAVQLAAGILALRLIRITGRRSAWALIAAGMLLLVVRRGIVFYHAIFGAPPVAPDLAAEIPALVVSLLLIVGVAMIGPLFQSILHTKQQLEAANRRLLTESKELARAHESLRRAQYSLDHASDAVMWAAETSGLVYVNEAACRLTGFSWEELLTKSVADIDTGVSPESWAELWRRTRDHGPQLVTTRHRTKSGRSIPVEVSISYVSFEGRSYLCGIVRDIGARVEAARGLRESERRFRTLFENAALGLALTDAEGRLIVTNAALQTLLGYSDDMLRAMSYLDRTHPDDREADSQLFTELRDGRRDIYFIEKRLRRADGRVLWVHVTVSPVRDEDGRPTHFIRMIKDISDRKKIEEEEQITKVRLEALLALNQMGAATLREITTFALESAVRVTRSKIGYLAFASDDESELVMQAWSDAALADCAIIDKPLRYPVATTGLWGEAVRQRRPIVTNDYAAPNPWQKGCPVGHVALVRHMNAPLIDGDRIVFVAGVGNKDEEYTDDDIRQLTLLMQGMWSMLQRRRADDELRRHKLRLEETVAERTRRLQEANQDLEDFAHVVSHDLKAPLRAISQVAGWFMEDYGANLDARGEEMIQLLNGRAHRLEKLIDGILEFSRVGRAPERLTPVELRQVAAAVVELLAPPAYITITLAANLPCVMADATLMQQIFQNLLSNAVKFMDKPEGRIDVTARERENDWLVCVADNGPGIEAKYHEKIFQIFQTLAARDKFESTGIGLALVKRAVERGGGKVWLESTPGQGCAFYFTLPKERAANESLDADPGR
jgi:PAS domain S-box-containing protein